MTVSLLMTLMIIVVLIVIDSACNNDRDNDHNATHQKCAIEIKLADSLRQ